MENLCLTRGIALLTYFERLKKLEDFGLTEYQARVYLALLEFDVATAGQIPSASKVPRTKIYGIMRQLHDKGLVQIVPETPLKYRAVPFDLFLEKQIKDMREKAEELDANKDLLSKEFTIGHKKPEKQGKFEVLYGRRNVRDRLNKIYSSAKKEILSIGTSNSPARIVNTTLWFIEDKKKEGLMIRYAFPVNAGNKDKVEKIASFAEIRHIDRNPPMHFVVVDMKECMLIHRVPDDADPVRGDDVAIWTDDEAIVNAMQEIAESFLNGGVGYTSFNALGPILGTIGSWIDSIGIDTDRALTNLGIEVGSQIADNLKSKSRDPLLKEMSSYWKKHDLGEVKVERKKPFIITMENYMNCRESPEIAKFLCSFIKATVKTIMINKLNADCKVKEMGCPNHGRTYCRLQLDIKKKKK
jgi:sugar-specific transcriptional regulator TrmB/predicted hydrocarbon binding protein